jgi:hypothetical protein
MLSSKPPVKRNKADRITMYGGGNGTQIGDAKTAVLFSLIHADLIP